LLTVRVAAAAATHAAAAAACEATAAELRPLLGDWLFAEGTVDLPALVLQRLRDRRQTLAVAESCTGGLVAKSLTDVAGSSDVFLGGVVAYSNASKTALLGVPAALVAEHGAVSEPVAAAMALGARERLGADVAVATTGVAGPGGGTAQKPVGLVCFGCADGTGARAWTVRIPDLGRTFVRDRALFEVWRALLGR
jgi:nicotinamide-nucleotide amidase